MLISHQFFSLHFSSLQFSLHVATRKVLKLLVIHININSYSLSKNKIYTSPHGTQSIKNLSKKKKKNLSNLLFFFFFICLLYCYSITLPLHRLFHFEGWINHSLLWTALFVHSCDLGIGWCLPALRYFGSFVVVLNYSFLLSVKKIKCFGYAEIRPGCVTYLTKET